MQQARYRRGSSHANVILRPARAFDAAPCAAIIDAWIEETTWLPRHLDAATIARHLREEVFATQTVTIAERDGEVAGFLALDRSGCVTSLYVATSDRRAGVGRRLLAEAKTAMEALHLWVFAANHAARRFYLREGFHEGRRSAGDNIEGLPDVEYLWTRDSPHRFDRS